MPPSNALEPLDERMFTKSIKKFAEMLHGWFRDRFGVYLGIVNGSTDIVPDWIQPPLKASEAPKFFLAASWTAINIVLDLEARSEQTLDPESAPLTAYTYSTARQCDEIDSFDEFPRIRTWIREYATKQYRRSPHAPWSTNDLYWDSIHVRDPGYVPGRCLDNIPSVLSSITRLHARLQDRSVGNDNPALRTQQVSGPWMFAPAPVAPVPWTGSPWGPNAAVHAGLIASYPVAVSTTHVPGAQEIAECADAGFSADFSTGSG